MEESRRIYKSVCDMVESMPCKLEWKSFTEGSGHRFAVFWSKNGDELQRLLADSSITNTGRGTGLSHMDEIKSWLQLVCMENYLLQFWTPVTIGDKRYLTTLDQPFAMKELVKGLCSYRKYCLRTRIPIHDVTAEEGHLIGPPRRVFLNGLPEVCLDVRHYSTEEYPQRDYAETCGIRCYLAFPFHKSHSRKFDCVVELVADGFQPGLCKLAKLLLRNYGFDDVGLTKWPGAEIEEMLQAVCDTHQLPLAQTWVSIPYSCRYKNEVRHEKRGSYIKDIKLHDFGEASSICHVKRGQGVVGKAFSSKGACFCNDISQLSKNEYSLVVSARQAGLRGCFAMSLRNTTSLFDYVYIVEFFLPSNESGDSRNLIKMVLATMKQHLKSFEVASGQELGEKLFVEVIKTSSTDELDSFEICDLTGGTGKALDCQEGANTFLDASNLNQRGEVVHFGNATIHAENVNNAEQKIVSMELRDTNSQILKNQRAIKRIIKEYGITRTILLQHSGKKLEEVAAYFGVSRSTFKRICREHQIFRWPRRKSKHDDGPSKIAQKFVQPKEEIIEDSCVKELQLPIHPIGQDLNSKPDSTQNATTVQNDSSIVVKVKYGDDMIRFNLSVSSGKTDVEEEIARRFRLWVGGFIVKYLDEDEEWISVTCDEDWKTCISIMKSLGKNTVKMSVKPVTR